MHACDLQLLGSRKVLVTHIHRVSDIGCVACISPILRVRRETTSTSAFARFLSNKTIASDLPKIPTICGKNLIAIETTNMSTVMGTKVVARSISKALATPSP